MVHVAAGVGGRAKGEMGEGDPAVHVVAARWLLLWQECRTMAPVCPGRAGVGRGGEGGKGGARGQRGKGQDPTPPGDPVAGGSRSCTNGTGSHPSMMMVVQRPTLQAPCSALVCVAWSSTPARLLCPRPPPTVCDTAKRCLLSPLGL